MSFLLEYLDDFRLEARRYGTIKQKSMRYQAVHFGLDEFCDISAVPISINRYILSMFQV